MQKSAPIDLATHPLTNWTGPHGLPDFSAFDDAAFAPVFEAALSAHEAEIARIAGNAEAPDIDNTLAALELAGDALSKVPRFSGAGPARIPMRRSRRWSGRSRRAWHATSPRSS